jgi:hypothetical protein
MATLVEKIDGLAVDVGTQIKANRDLITQGAMTEAIVKSAIDSSTDIDTILARLTALVSGVAVGDILADKVALGINSATDIDTIIAGLNSAIAALGGTRQFSRQWVETATGVPLLEVCDVGSGGNVINASYFALTGNNTIGPQQFPTGVIKPLQPGRLALPAASWSDTASDSEIQKRLARLMFPGGIFRSTVTAVNAGNTDLTGLGLDSTTRFVITRFLIQSTTATPNTAVLRSIGTTSSNLESYRLAGDGAGISEVRTPHSFIRGAAGANISINLAIGNTAATPVSVYAQIQWYLEDTITGLPVS